MGKRVQERVCRLQEKYKLSTVNCAWAPLSTIGSNESLEYFQEYVLLMILDQNHILTESISGAYDLVLL